MFIYIFGILEVEKWEKGELIIYKGEVEIKRKVQLIYLYYRFQGLGLKSFYINKRLFNCICDYNLFFYKINLYGYFVNLIFLLLLKKNLKCKFFLLIYIKMFIVENQENISNINFCLVSCKVK